MTGSRLSGVAARGAKTLTKRQSSLPAGWPRFTSEMPPNGLAYCTQGDPATTAGRTPSQCGAGCGARQRSGPTGGAAYGMPSQTALPATA
jgi:hypothetical protein